MTENACGTSRRSFLSSGAGGFLAACLPRRILFAGDDMPAPDSAYRGQKIANTHLKYDVFVTPIIPVVTTDFAPDEPGGPWPPISSTLIYGSRDAVVVDSFISLEQARAQADWIAAPRKNLPTIFLTQ